MTLRVHVDPAFAQATLPLQEAENGSIQFKQIKHWYLPKISLVDGVKNIVAHNPSITKISISTSVIHHLMQKKAGEAPALLVTSGFEHWPFLRQPLENSPDLRPIRLQTILNKDKVFGIKERTDQNGQVISRPSDEDIDFLISKLKFNETKTVAVGFLHSSKNSENENHIESKLSNAELKVIKSSQFDFPLAENQKSNEVARWWRAFSSAFVSEGCDEIFGPLKSWTAENKIQLNWASDENGLNWLDGAYSSLAYHRTEKKSDWKLYIGPEFCGLVRGEFLGRVKDEFKFGPVLLKAPEFESMRHQLLSEVIVCALGGLAYSKQTCSIDPGPMFLGRSMKLTVADVFCVENETNLSWAKDIEGRPAFVPEKINSAISSLARTVKRTENEVAFQVKKLFFNELELMLSSYNQKNCKAFGPWATLILNSELNKRTQLCE